MFVGLVNKDKQNKSCSKILLILITFGLWFSSMIVACGESLKKLLGDIFIYDMTS